MKKQKKVISEKRYYHLDGKKIRITLVIKYSDQSFLILPIKF